LSSFAKEGVPFRVEDFQKYWSGVWGEISPKEKLRNYLTPAYRRQALSFPLALLHPYPSSETKEGKKSSLFQRGFRRVIEKRDLGSNAEQRGFKRVTQRDQGWSKKIDKIKIIFTVSYKKYKIRQII
jgi:hypothetical protein